MILRPLPNLVETDAQVDPTVRLVGEAEVRIGKNVRIDAFTLLVASGPLIIEDHVHIGPHCSLHAGEGITLRRGADLAPGVRIFTWSDDYSTLGLVGSTWGDEKTNFIRGAVEIGEHAIVGANSVVLPGVTVAALSAIGALSLVNKSIDKEGLIWGGVPIKKIGKRNG